MTARAKPEDFGCGTVACVSNDLALLVDAEEEEDEDASLGRPHKLRVCALGIRAHLDAPTYCMDCRALSEHNSRPPMQHSVRCNMIQVILYAMFTQLGRIYDTSIRIVNPKECEG